MPRPLSEMIESLRALDLRLRRQLEEAETWVPQINQVVEQLRLLQLLDDSMLLGDIIHQSSYNPAYGPHDSCQLLQAAFGIGYGGLGVVLWDSEDYWRFRNIDRSTPTPELQVQMTLNFQPFERCGNAVRALLLPQIRPLVTRITERARV